MSPRQQRLDAAAEDYHAHRIALGVPEGGKDYALGDTFPHEADLDLLNGVSFSKGCFVGQEVVSRMQHRGTRAQARGASSRATAPLQPGSRDHGRRGGDRHGRLGGRQSRRWRCSASTARRRRRRKGEPLTAGGVAIALRQPTGPPTSTPAAGRGAP